MKNGLCLCFFGVIYDCKDTTDTIPSCAYYQIWILMILLLVTSYSAYRSTWSAIMLSEKNPVTNNHAFLGSPDCCGAIGTRTAVLAV